MNAINFFSQEDKDQIVDAIKRAELNTSGEIRLHIENSCKEDVLDRAAFWFKELNMHKTNLRNGVLFYLAIDDKKFAILGDAGINSLCPENFWEEIKANMLKEFKENNFTKGLVIGIEMAGKALKDKFPHKSNDVNELNDEISFNTNGK